MKHLKVSILLILQEKKFCYSNFLKLKAREIVELQCADFDTSVQKNGDNEDYYGIYIFTEEVEDWFAGY